ncbi:hypothetical protein SDRG_11059 [Saprolegnia diclina VS20]|uniref:Uncharacterized protein n=1 Tax=Saprolegnia diclina (strain VS20) TaxID=1156394 RepID=T0RND3_SAPDV|nr:hypothetical protein SDRG_11059 [Saprolegnia diclina VS20]EQC31462.1 hypothetical protein SDRG_11059 [Saprolegnia diclina VS20]|eukprot:XP_008615303.1 hypothetical protein SDRG_11059 [Saprolegnia diclina VS20]
MKGATIVFCVLAVAASTKASPFSAGRALTAMDCDKDCSDMSTASTVLCEMGKYGSCAVTKVAQGGSYVVRGVSGWFQSRDSDSGSESDDEGKAAPSSASSQRSTTGPQGSFHGSTAGSHGSFRDAITEPHGSNTGSHGSFRDSISGSRSSTSGSQGPSQGSTAGSEGSTTAPEGSTTDAPQ